MKIENVEIEEIKKLKEDAKMLEDTRMKGKITYKIWDISVKR